MAIFDLWQQQDAVSVSIHPQTTQVVQQAGGSTLLVGHVLVTVRRAVAVASLEVRLTGTQHLDWRSGQGPSSTMHSVRHQHLDVAQPLLAATADLARGTHRYGFELALPSNLPPSVTSSLGHTAYALAATLKRGWLQAADRSSVAISVARAPAASDLTYAPVSLDARVGDFKLSVYSASRVLVPGSAARIQAFVSRPANSSGGSSNGPAMQVERVSGELRQTITHKLSGARPTTRDVVAQGSSPLGGRAKEAVGGQWLDDRSRDSLGDLLDGLGLASAATLFLHLPEDSVQASGSGAFDVAHELAVTVDLRCGDEVRQVALSAPVVVVPRALGCCAALALALPCYTDVAKDVVLDTAALECFCADNGYCVPPPAYSV
ncbi:hypothetical protein LPJ53_003081 [Coemansia erecta]|uniref:Arrestin-like N-terminal domain-containing protein n=1 Tax=Coemansia erecta TaxID=147472 RepID=A0A9W7Y253_9FUNG|nr:hypothetical protein LPJ53_003081 [Coemansia erecta]